MKNKSTIEEFRRIPNHINYKKSNKINLKKRLYEKNYLNSNSISYHEFNDNKNNLKRIKQRKIKMDKDNNFNKIEDLKTINKKDKNFKNKSNISRFLNLNINIQIDEDFNKNKEKEIKNLIDKSLYKIQKQFTSIKKINFDINESNKEILDKNLKINSSNSIPYISLSETFNIEAQNRVKKNLWNVLKNSTLNLSNKFEHKNIIFETTKIVFQILNSINFSNNISFEKNFFRLFNLQIPINQKLFSVLDYGAKIKIFCYLFCKYFKKNLISTLYEDFYSIIDIPKICSDNRSKKKCNFKIFIKFFSD